MKHLARFFHNLKLQSKLLLSYALIVLIPLSMWGVYTYQQANAALLEQAQVGFQDICVNISGSFNSKFQRIENAFSVVAGDSSIGQIINGDYVSNYQKYYDITNKFDPTFNTLRILNPEIKDINIFTDGSIQSARQCFHARQSSRGEHEWLSSVSSERMTWFVEGRRLFVARQVFDLSHLSRSAIILLELDYDSMIGGNISDELQNYGLFVQDDAGNILYRSDHLTRDWGQNAMDAEDLRAFCLRRDDILYHAETLCSTGWTLSMYMDANSMLMPPQAAFRSAILQLAFSALLLMIVIPLISRTMVKRIEALDTYLSQVVKGGFQEDISSEDRDEVGGITNSVGMMVRETRALIGEVYESRLQQREAEIKALQSQINPHFLYNTLSAINWQAIKNGDPDISKIATALSTFYRSTLNQGKNITTVQQELETTRAYLDIQQTIHDGSFDVEYSVADGVLEYNMPGIILQPIVENAIEHGIDMKTDGERGKIRIEAREERGDIVFEVCDNGPGIPEETVREVFTDERRGYGVKNVNERLRLFFDDRYGLSFRNVGRAGTCAVIRIPQYIDLEPLKELSQIR